MECYVELFSGYKNVGNLLYRFGIDKEKLHKVDPHFSIFLFPAKTENLRILKVDLQSLVENN